MIPWVFLLLLASLSPPLQAQATSEQISSLRIESPGPLQGFCLLFSGEELGYLEPCGCTRPLLGGIAKRHGFLESLSGPWLAVSLGDLVGNVRRQDELKAETLVQALVVMNYSVHNLGEMDLEMGQEVLAYLFSRGPVSLLSSNLLFASPLVEVAPYKVYELVFEGKSLRVGFLGILSPSLIGSPPTGVEIIPPAEALPPLIKELEEKVDLLVLLSHSTLEESIGLARAFPEFHLVAGGHGADHPMVLKEGNTWVFTPGIRGKHMILYRCGVDGGSGVIETITLDERFKDSASMLSLLDDYQERLKEEDLLSQVEKFPLPGQASYVGSHACNACHPGVFQHWGGTPHAMAYETLQKVGRAFDPECVTCHVVGFNHVSGWQGHSRRWQGHSHLWQGHSHPEQVQGHSESSAGLAGVGCEACHGPGNLHVASQRQGVRGEGYGKVSPEVCLGCHDPEHGPQFQFESYWERIRHPAETPVVLGSR